MFTEPRPRDELVFRQKGRQIRVKVSATLASNSAAAIRIALHEGVGFTMIPSFVAQHDFARGTIEPVLSDWSLPELTVFAVYPHRRFLSPKVKVFIEALLAAFGDDASRDPWWQEQPQMAAPGAVSRRARPATMSVARPRRR